MNMRKIGASVLLLFGMVVVAYATEPQMSGEYVEDSLASTIYGGGCSGYCNNDACTAQQKLICGGNAYVNGGAQQDQEPNQVTAYFCTEVVNQETVCDTCSAGYQSCAKSGSTAPVELP